MILKAGDTREKGDEVRTHPNMGGATCEGRLGQGGYTRNLSWKRNGPLETKWSPVQLIGHKILQSDLMHAEFRRGE